MCPLGRGNLFCGPHPVATLILFAVAASNKASADSENASTAAVNVKRDLETHEAVQDITMSQIKSDLAEIKADLKDIKTKLK
jgi:hypothetical protein